MVIKSFAHQHYIDRFEVGVETQEIKHDVEGCSPLNYASPIDHVSPHQHLDQQQNYRHQVHVFLHLVAPARNERFYRLQFSKDFRGNYDHVNGYDEERSCSDCM